jgi:hypothetical protein
LEQIIRSFLTKGKVTVAARKNIIKTGIKDLDKGLTHSLPIVHYTSNKITKSFIKDQAIKINPKLKIKSGAWYRLNRWRDDQITKNRKITYGDLIHEFIRLNLPDTKFERIPVGRYINFLADYMTKEKNPNRKTAISEWKKLKKMDIAKDYISWKKCTK